LEVQRRRLEGDSDLTRTMPTARARLLLVDDEPNILATLRRALEVEGYAAEVAGNGKAALDKLADGAFDLVLCDVAMPDMGGLEVLERVHKAHPDLPVVMMSGVASLQTAVQATKLGAHDFLEKPLSTDKVVITVQNALGYARLRRERAELAARVGADFAMIGSGPRMRA